MGFGGTKIDTSQQAQAIRDAAALERKSFEEAMAFQEKVYKQNRRDIRPWLDAGKEAIGQVREGIQEGRWDMPVWAAPKYKPPSREDYVHSPGYQYRLDRAQEGIMRQASQRGSVLGGETLSALQRHHLNFYDEDYAKARGDYEMTYDRRLSNSMSEYNSAKMVNDANYARLSGLANIQTSAMPMVNLRNQSAAAINQYRIGGAQAMGAGMVGAANANLQGQIFNAQADQQKFQNMMSVLSFGSMMAMGMGGFGGGAAAAGGGSVWGYAPGASSHWGAVTTPRTNISMFS